eukprot:CAMPEP_0197932754 /NCGR_PEP_ID=MMETSP1439-20131203/109084_1 /TAXON_ID=66791 /ORGANISM="Gonyaulax spinifera, Strain CCMP409" /LENGTH=430 /DNA_ID=CAMNT_0043555555 /DNA_START=50 /DNA_END=1342 /DNA_ORIENTATION=+
MKQARSTRRVIFGGPGGPAEPKEAEKPEKHVATPAPSRNAGQWKLPPRYTVKHELGKGSYGKVCEAHDSGRDKLVAIKKITSLFEDTIDCKRILREIAIMSRLEHNNIVQIYDIPPPSDLLRFNELHIVMEKCDTDIKKLCRRDVTLTPLHVNVLLYNLLLGLKYLHTAGVYHRDLTPANCLVNKDLTVKICDFGLSRAIGVEMQNQVQMPPTPHCDRLMERHLTAHVVTRWYRAPELILLQDNYTEAIDVWSAGCIYAELLGMLEGTRTSDRKPLFPGHTCFPMSPDPQHETDYKFHTSGLDQLNVIFDVLGTPSEEEIAKQDRSDARRYLRRFEARKGTGLSSRFGHVADQSRSILERMLRFDPKKRIVVPEALAHELFADFRDPSKETSAPSLLNLSFEMEKDPGEAFLRKHFCEEIQKFHPEVLAM